MAEVSGNLQRYRDIRTVTVVGAVINILLSLVKIIVGYLGQSHALMADGLHSLSDLLSDALVIYAAKHGSQGADQEHPYGHARIETAFTVGLGLILILVALGISLDAGRRLLNPELLLHPGTLALSIAALSVLSKEALYHYTLRVARRLRSPLLQANAWHHRTDALSSVVVLVGLIGVQLGFDYLDALASVGVALMIAKIGWDLGWNAIRELVDTGLDPERVAKIRESIAQVDGVKDMHLLRTRRMGGDALVDVHVQVDNPYLSVSEGHQIGEYVRTRLLEEIEEVADVTVHIDCQEDGASRLCNGLPLRQEILAKLQERLNPIVDPATVKNVTLHYLSGKVYIELLISLAVVKNIAEAQELIKRLRQSVKDLQELASIQIYFG